MASTNATKRRKRLDSSDRLVVSTQEAAYMLGVSPKTLTNWRYQRDKGPAYTHMGGRVVYAVEDLRAYVKANRVER